MRKYGKYEKMPDGTRAKQPTAKSMLLQTYFTGLICLVLSVSMFFGTSYAWFTSEVNNAGNEIYIGTLDVGLFKKTDANPLDLSEAENKLFDNTIRWEPGYTALETIQVVNKGDLAFKYALSFTVDSATANTQVAENFEVWVFRHYGQTYEKPASYDAMKETVGWDMVGNLAELLAGKVVLQGNMNTVRDTDDQTAANDGTTDGVATVDTYTIALHMKKNADKTVMGQKLSLNVKLVAYQKTVEADAFGNYDRLVMTPADLKEALAEGGNVTLLSNITLEEGVTVPKDVTVNLDLNGYTIAHTKECTEGYAMISNDGKLIINDSANGENKGKISFIDTGTGDPSFGWGSYTIRNSGNLIVNGGIIEFIGNQQPFGTHCSLAIFQYSGSSTINGGQIVNDSYRSVRLWHGAMTINGGSFNGQVWVHCVDDSAVLTINGGSFAPANNGGDKSSVFVNNAGYKAELSITGGKFQTKVGCDDVAALAGCITGGEFTDGARNETNSALFAN